MRVVAHTLTPWRATLGVTTARGDLAERSGWWLSLWDDAGRVGHGEAAPLPAFGGETRAACWDALEGAVAAGALLGAWPDAWAPLAALTARVDDLDLPPVARAAVVQAALALQAARAGWSVTSLLGGQDRWHDEVGHLRRSLLGADHEDVPPSAAAVKLKVTAAHDLDDVVRGVRAWRARLAAGCALRLDANGRWSADEAAAVWPQLAGVSCVEEALSAPSAPALARLRARGGPAVFVDESCRDAETLETLRGAVDGVVLKPMLNGGVDRALHMAEVAARHGLQVMVTTTFGTRQDWLACRALAATVDARHGGETPRRVLVATGLDPQGATCEATTAPPATPPWTVPHPVAAAARQRPEHRALRVAGGPWLTWGALAAQVAQRAAALRASGVRPGDVVALTADTTAESVVWLHAVTWCGACVAPLPARTTPRDVRESLLALAADWILTEDNDAGRGAAAAAVAAARAGQALSREALARTAASAAPLPWVPATAGRAWARLLTSGSSGRRSVVTLTTEQLMLSALGSAQRVGHAATDVWRSALPLHHVGGLSVLWRTAWLATSADLRARFDAAATAAAVAAGACTQLSVVPAWLDDLCGALMQAELAPHPAFRVALVGGAALPERTRARAATLGLPLAVSWGMTEAASQIASRAPWDGGEGAAPLCVAEVHAVPHDLQATPTQEPGRLAVVGPLVGQPFARPEPRAPELARGALITGDLGTVVDGRVRVSGRADAVLRCGGELVDPDRLAALLREHPGVADALVVGLPDARLGERPAALVVASAPAEASELGAALGEWVAARVPPFAVPAPVHVCASLPRTALGKPSRVLGRRWLRDQQRLEGDAHVIGQRAGAAALSVDARVDVRDPGVRGAVAAHDREDEGHGAAPEPGDRHVQRQRVAEPHRPLIVGLRVDQGHDPGRAHDLRQRQPHVAHERLEGAVGVLEDAAEEDDASGVDLGETDAVIPSEGHGAGSGAETAARRARRSDEGPDVGPEVRR